MLEAHLKDVPFFNSLSKKELAEIARATDEIDAKRGRCSPARAMSDRSSS